jgi:hypothetical protein
LGFWNVLATSKGMELALATQRGHGTAEKCLVYQMELVMVGENPLVRSKDEDQLEL